MGSLETGVSLSFKKDNSFRSLSSKIERQNSKPRSVFSRLLLPKKLGYSQWISILAIFSLFFGLFQLLLPLSVMERSSGEDGELVVSWDSIKLKDVVGELDFGESLRLEPKWVANEVNMSHGSESIVRFGHRKPLLAMVFADLAFDSYQILMTTVAAALQEIGYSIEVVSEENGPAVTVWSNMGVPVTIVQTKDHQCIGVDWLNYDGILVNSLEAKGILSCLMKEPFTSLPLIWTIHERILATRFSDYTTSGKTGILSDWKKSFKRATVVVFPDYALPIIYSRFDAGNYFVVPGAPAEACELGQFVNMNEERLHNEMDIKLDDFAIAIVGSHFLYKGLWLEHSLILQALKPLLAEFPSENSSSSRLKIFIVTGDATNNYTVAVEAISAGLKYPQGVVKHVVGDANADIALREASLVIYGSFLEEHLFPNILTKALCFGKLIVAPRLSMIEKFVEDRVNGYLFTKEKIEVLTEIVSQVVSRGKLTPLARNVASIGKETAKNLMVTDAVEGYASLLESVLSLPSEVAPAKASSEIPMGNKKEWQWGIFKTVNDAVYKSRTLSSLVYLDKIKHQNQTQEQIPSLGEDEAFLYRIWEEEKEAQMIQSRKRMLDEELKDRSGSTRGTWEDVYRNAKRADRAKNDLHERDDGELERTGQPLCIYEPYFGEGTWPFLHHTSLYRGIGLCSKGRRPGGDDIDASSRLPLLSNTYYRDLLGDMGALFSVAHRVDRVHKNAWIGFQSWRVTARKESLSKRAESALLNATQKRKNGDTLYFWSRMDLDPRNPRRLEFWSFCDAINAGNCRSAFSSTLRRMYGINQSWDSLPPMPFDGDTWSVMHTWALPTRSFLEYVMFARMFVDAMDAQMYNAHHESGLCYLSPAKDKHCYSRVLELLINVWAYHSARRMVYINPETGVMQEHHMLKARKGQMWVKWFSFNTLKKMDEDLAEQFDSDPSETRRLWPSTGEVFWQGMLEKERMLRLKEKEKRRRKSKDKLVRMRRRTHQKVLGKYVKPPPEEPETGNSSVSVER